MKLCGLVVAAAALMILSVRGEEPSIDPAEIEPPVLSGNLIPEQGSAPPADIAQLERRLNRARESAAGAERLVRVGVLAKVEAENRALRVLHIEAELAQAQVSAAEQELGRKKQQLEEPKEIDLAQSQLEDARKNAQLAAAKLKQAEIDAAALNLERQRKLAALGSARKSSVKKAEEALAQLKAQMAR